MHDMSELNGKRILIVDDEADVLETLEEILSSCAIDSALDFETAQKLLDENPYDVAILDIMGVRGYELLEIARKKEVPALMLTAHAFSPDNLMKSIKDGAHAFVPKEKISEIDVYVLEILRAVERGKGREKQGAWFARLRPYFYKKFGYDWREKYEDFYLDIETIDLIVVPTDFSPYSCEAFVWAAFLAKEFHARILVLHVITEKDAEAITKVPGNPWELVLEREDKQMVDDFSACLIGDFHKTVNKETLVEVGTPYKKIVETAKKENAGMIVMSTHGKGGLSRVLMGGVAEKVVRNAPCPVFTVKPKSVEINPS
jgi:nucleotide-binding universal stress UspA family protein